MLAMGERLIDVVARRAGRCRWCRRRVEIATRLSRMTARGRIPAHVVTLDRGFPTLNAREVAAGVRAETLSANALHASTCPKRPRR